MKLEEYVSEREVRIAISRSIPMMPGTSGMEQHRTTVNKVWEAIAGLHAFGRPETPKDAQSTREFDLDLLVSP